VHTVLVGMAEMAVVRCEGQEQVQLKTTLGSCVGVVLRDRSKRIYGLAHVMLPEKQHDDEASGKYADSAIPALLSRMEEQGSSRQAVEACLIGGACMFQCDTATMIGAIGKRNVEAARRIIRDLRIPIALEDTGGSQGRTVILDCRTAELAVRTLQKLEISGRV
jgi:chemotaxis protein CheD